MISKKLYSLMLALVLALTIIAMGCGGGDEGKKGEEGGKKPETAKPEGGDTASNLPKYTSKGDEGSVSGSVSLDGAAPKPRKIEMDADDFCKKQNPSGTDADDVVVDNGKIANVIVYVKEGPATKFSYDKPADQVVLDQKNCMYTPHIVGLRTKQELKVTTSDDTTHNIHPLPKNNKEWNKSQGPKADPIVDSFARAEVIPVKCNQHPWMKAYLAVFDHPFYSITGKDGKFELKNLPPGDYTLEAWHEKLGMQTAKVTIGAKEDKKDIEIKFKSESAYKTPEENGVKVGTTLILPMLEGR